MHLNHRLEPFLYLFYHAAITVHITRHSRALFSNSNCSSLASVNRKAYAAKNNSKNVIPEDEIFIMHRVKMNCFGCVDPLLNLKPLCMTHNAVHLHVKKFFREPLYVSMATHISFLQYQHLFCFLQIAMHVFRTNL